MTRPKSPRNLRTNDGPWRAEALRSRRRRCALKNVIGPKKPSRAPSANRGDDAPTATNSPPRGVEPRRTPRWDGSYGSRIGSEKPKGRDPRREPGLSRRVLRSDVRSWPGSRLISVQRPFDGRRHPKAAPVAVQAFAGAARARVALGDEAKHEFGDSKEVSIGKSSHSEFVRRALSSNEG